MSLLSYETHTSVAGTVDMLGKLRTFLTGLGWVSEDYQQSKAWESDGDGTYSWAHVGDQDFFDVSSTGYGTQTLRIRMLVDPLDATDDTFYFSPIDPTDPAVDDTVGTNPYLQNAWQDATYNRISIPHGSFTQAWFFANARFFLVVLQVSTTEFISFAFGLPDLESGLQTEDIQFVWQPHYMPAESPTYSWTTLTANAAHWWNCFGWNPSVGAGNIAWWDGAARDTTHVKSNMRIQRTAIAGEFNQLDNVLAMNGFTNARTLVKPTIFLCDAATGTWYPAATLPVYYCVYSGLAPGSQVDYSAESFLAFPALLTSYTYGMMIRIA